MLKRKIALFGGTFDPVHLGHTAVAAHAAEHIGAEKVIFVPAKRSPLKQSFPEASDRHRLKMLTLALADNETFRISDYELKKPQPSYTLETVRHFQDACGGETLIYWLTGADNIEELPRWYSITELIDGCFLSLMYRAGCEKPNFTRFEAVWGAQRVKKLQQNIIKTPLINISSTEIRKAIAAGRDVSNMLEPAVAEYIGRHGLYRSKPAL